MHVAAIDNSLAFPHMHPRGWRTYTVSVRRTSADSVELTACRSVWLAALATVAHRPAVL